MAGGTPVTPVSENGSPFGGDVIQVTLTADTSILADNDVIAATQEIAGMFREPGGCIMLESVVLLDGDDQNTDIDLVFLNANGSVGAENAAFTPTDAVADTITGMVSLLAATHFADLIDSRLATAGNLHIIMKAASGSTSLYVAAVCRSGTPTYSAAGLKLKLGFQRI